MNRTLSDKKVKYLFLVLLLPLSVIAQDPSINMFNSTIKISASKDTIINGKKDKTYSYGTGCFVQLHLGKDTILCMVTNRHVVQNYTEAVLKFNSYRIESPYSYGDYSTIILHNLQKLWIYHPSEDLAILPIWPTLGMIYEHTKRPTKLFRFDESTFETDSLASELSALLDVLMVGYPKGFYDTLNNIPLVRKGITATPIYINYNKEKKFLVDIPIYSGSSGSPIVLYGPAGYGTKGSGLTLDDRTWLLGIVTDSKDYLSVGEATINKKVVKSKTWLPFNIAVVLKASLLLDFKPLLLKKINDYAYGQLLVQSISFSSQ